MDATDAKGASLPQSYLNGSDIAESRRARFVNSVLAGRCLSEWILVHSERCAAVISRRYVRKKDREIKRLCNQATEKGP